MRFELREKTCLTRHNWKLFTNYLSSDSLNVPLGLAQRTQIAILDPLRHAAVVKRVIAVSPYN